MTPTSGQTAIASERRTLSSVGPTVMPRILGIGTQTTDTAYSQQELLDRFAIHNRRIRSVFLNSGIERRFLAIPQQDAHFRPETQGELLAKHRTLAIDIGSTAIRNCLDAINKRPEDVSYICCVTTTGFLSPGLSARIAKNMGLSRRCTRLDVVGMGCNAGLNALNAVTGWTRANPGKLAIMLCVEICSAAYVMDETMRTSVVNSLFGDGAAAVALMADEACPTAETPVILKFNSRIVLDAIEAMRYDWNEHHGKFSFFLDPDIPYVVGANVESTIAELLEDTGLRRSDIMHWIVHSGGKKVIDAVRVNLGLSAHDLRHTSEVLRDYGNLSSGSFLFSLQRLFWEKAPAPGDYGIMMTMGPGSSIETALIRWPSTMHN